DHRRSRRARQSIAGGPAGCVTWAPTAGGCRPSRAHPRGGSAGAVLARRRPPRGDRDARCARLPAAARPAARTGWRRERRLPSLRPRGERVEQSGRAQDRLAPERSDAQFRRRPTKARIDEQELVEVELAGTARGGEPCFDLESRAPAGRQSPFRRDPPAGDEEGLYEARIAGRDEHAARESSHPFEPLQLAADPLERGDAIAEPARVLESSS